MTDSLDDELPYVAISALSVSHFPNTEVKKRPIKRYEVDVSEETCRRSREREAAKQRDRCLSSSSDSSDESDGAAQIVKLGKDLIKKIENESEALPEEPPGRQFFLSKDAYCSFRADTLAAPSRIRGLVTGDIVRMVVDIRDLLQETGYKQTTEILRYLFFFTSVHEDELVVQHCLDLLLDFSWEWYIDYKVLLSVFVNWGADISQVLPSYSSHNKGNNNCNKLVPTFNVDAVLQIVSDQLRLRGKINEYSLIDDGFGLWDADELLFGLLLFLSLDKNYVDCCLSVRNCMSELLTSVLQRSTDPWRGLAGIDSADWLKTYCLLATQLETNFYNLTAVVSQVLYGSEACEALQLCLCFVAIQSLVGVNPEKITFSFGINKVASLVQVNLRKIISLSPTEVYSLLIFLDTILRHARVCDKVNFMEFVSWLSRLENKLKCGSPRIYAQLASYRTLWECSVANPAADI